MIKIMHFLLLLNMFRQVLVVKDISVYAGPACLQFMQNNSLSNAEITDTN